MSMKISTKLYAGFSLVIIAAVIMGLFALSKMSGINDRLNGIVDGSAEKVKLGARINQDVLAITRAEKNMILAKTQEEMDEYTKFIADTKTKMQKRREQLRKLADDVGKEKLDEFAARWEEYLKINEKVRSFARLDSNGKAKRLSAGEARKAFDELENALETIAQESDRDFETAKLNSNARQLARSGEKVKLAERLLQNAIEYQRAEKNFILVTTQEEMDEYELIIENVQKEIESGFDKLGKISNPDEKIILDKAREAYDRFKILDKQVTDLSRTNGNVKAFNLSAGQGRQISEQCEALITEIVNLNNEDMANDSKASDKNYAAARTLVVTLIVVCALFAAGIAYYISRSITKPLNKVGFMLKDISEGEGDLTKRLDINSKDEIGYLARWFDIFMDKLHDIIYQVALNTEQLASAATEISSSAEELSAGVAEQTNQTTQVSTAIEEMTSTIVESSRNTSEAADKAKEAADKSQDGSRLSTDASSGMEEIVQSSMVTAQNIKGLAEKATAIGEIIKVIDDIADQTNLLALNAAIEAARAGEQGRGFAVVADEVRKLAERTTSATKEVADTIKGIQVDVNTANGQIEESGEVVNKGKELVENTNNALNEI